MSDHWIRIIPVDPHFVPTDVGQNAALAILRAAAPRADAVSSATDEQIVFRDCGENFERVRCPACGKEIAMDTWQDWMEADDSEGGGFRLQPLVTPCCHRSATLDDLLYDMPQGFSRYALSAMNVGSELSSAVLAKLEDSLGCRLRVVYQAI